MEQSEVPPIAAAFEATFDQKVGYTISWKRSLPNLDLDGVEFKSLPSGLHGVKEDLIYFVHGVYAGVSAFVQEEADEQHRNANFVAIGALVPLSYGRLGKSWMHAAELRQLARARVKNAKDARALELFWKKYKQDESAVQNETFSPSDVRKMSLPTSQPDMNRKRKRAQSDASTSFSTSNGFSSDHPALSMSELLDTFGPLIFPIYRAALLRKRILLLTAPPVQQSCNLVYNISILSSVPQPLTELLQPANEIPLRIQTLFCVGVHDLPFLADDKRQKRWLACTTDDILGEKKEIYDYFVKLPSPQASGQTRRWPQIRTSDGKDIKATQRDLRRYRLLRSELRRTAQSQQSYHDDPNLSNEEANTPLMRASSTVLVDEVKHSEPGEASVCEPVSWTAMAYNGFLWWASAGEMEAWENEEARGDRELLEEVPQSSDLLRHIGGDGSSEPDDDAHQMQLKIAEATVLTAYFHRLTAAILQPLADLVEDADDETEEGVTDEAIEVSGEDVRAMGLDPWSTADKLFVTETAEFYFRRDVQVEEGGLRICGARIC